MTEIARVVARAHPAVLTAVFLVGAFAPMAVPTANLAPPWRGLLMAIAIGVPCLWYWAVFVVAASSRPGVAPPGRQWLFAAPPVWALMTGWAGWSTTNSPAATVFFIVFLIAVGAAAQALENADAPAGHASVGRILATTLLMLLTLIGVWVLWLKIRRVEARSAVGSG